MTKPDQSRCAECGGRAFPDAKGFMVCDNCGLQQNSAPIDLGSSKAPETAPTRLSPTERRAERRNEKIDKYTRPLEKRKEDRLKDAIEAQVHGLGLNDDQKARVRELVMGSRDGRPLRVAVAGAIFYVLMDQHGFVPNDSGYSRDVPILGELVRRAGGRRPLVGAYEALVKSKGRRPRSATADELIEYAVRALRLDDAGLTAKSLIKNFPKDFRLKDARRTALRALWYEISDIRESKAVMKQQIETVLGLRIAPVTTRPYGYGAEICNPFVFNMELQRCNNDARWIGPNGEGLCNKHAEMVVRRRVRVPRTKRWTDMVGKSDLSMLRKPRADWSGGSRRNRNRARDDAGRLLVHITMLARGEQEPRPQEHRLFFMETPSDEAMRRASVLERVFWCPRCEVEIAVDEGGDAGDYRIRTEFRKATHNGSRGSPIFIGEPKPSPSWHEFPPARNQGSSLQGHFVYDLDHDQWVVHALYWRIGDDKRLRWCVNCEKHVRTDIVTRPRKGSRLIDRTPSFSP